MPSAAAAPDGSVYVAFEDNTSASSGTIGLARSRDGGRTWTSAPLPGVSAYAFQPSIAVDSHGTIGVTWYDLRNDRAGDATLTADVRVAHSGDRGAAWQHTHVAGPVGLRTAPLPAHNYVGEYQGLATLPGRGFAAIVTLATPQARNGTAGIFFARIGPGLPAPTAQSAVQRRGETDYIFSYWTALGWTVLTLGIYGFYVLYQLIRRMRDHNARRLELLDAATTAAWEQAGRQGLQQELTPSFQRVAGQLAVMRQMTSEFREPLIWVALAVVAHGIVQIVAFVLLDQDLIRHQRAESGAGQELSLIYSRLGLHLPAPDPGQVKGPDNYLGRIVAAIVTFGIYLFWWYHDQMEAPNKHFASNWAHEGELVTAVEKLS